MKEEISERFLIFVVDITKLGKNMKKIFEGRHVYGQLFRASSSAGANYEESHSAQSTKDFIHKREICLKELRESLFWLKLIRRAKLILRENENIESLISECSELIRIIAKSVSTIKNKMNKK